MYFSVHSCAGSFCSYAFHSARALRISLHAVVHHILAVFLCLNFANPSSFATKTLFHDSPIFCSRHSTTVKIWISRRGIFLFRENFSNPTYCRVGAFGSATIRKQIHGPGWPFLHYFGTGSDRSELEDVFQPVVRFEAITD